MLYFAKDKLDWVKVRRIRHVKNIFKTQLVHGIFTFLWCVSRQVIQKDTHFLVLIIFPKLFQVLDELGHIHWVLKNHVGFQTFFFGNSWQNSKCFFVYFLPVNFEVWVGECVFFFGHWTPGKHSLVNIDYPIAISLSLF